MIRYETIDLLLRLPPSLQVNVLQQKMIAGGRGGYCFEQNMLFRAGLRSLGFAVTSLQARVVRNLAIDAERPALHMVLRVDLPDGPFLADAGFGNLAPTAPLMLLPLTEQVTPHEPMRFLPKLARSSRQLPERGRADLRTLSSRDHRLDSVIGWGWPVRRRGSRYDALFERVIPVF